MGIRIEIRDWGSESDCGLGFRIGDYGLGLRIRDWGWGLEIENLDWGLGIDLSALGKGNEDWELQLRIGIRI